MQLFHRPIPPLIILLQSQIWLKDTIQLLQIINNFLRSVAYTAKTLSLLKIDSGLVIKQHPPVIETRIIAILIVFKAIYADLLVLVIVVV